MLASFQLLILIIVETSKSNDRYLTIFIGDISTIQTTQPTNGRLAGHSSNVPPSSRRGGIPELKNYNLCSSHEEDFSRVASVRIENEQFALGQLSHYFKQHTGNVVVPLVQGQLIL